MNHQAPINLRDLFREDRKALIALAIFFIANLVGTWQRWTQPLISQGREVSTPARIINGEKLYTDIQSVFGPFAPYFNAALYKVFGIDLSVLKISGALCAIILLVTIYWISRQLMSVWKSTAATAAVIVICALKSTANYIQPYSRHFTVWYFLWRRWLFCWYTCKPGKGETFYGSAFSSGFRRRPNSIARLWFW
jgi:hypothetical protein